MVTALARLIEPLLNPLGLLWLIHVLAALRLLWKHRWLPGAGSALIAACLFIIGSTDLPDRLLATLEQPYTQRPLDRVAPADAVVMLGGVLNFSSHDLVGFEFSEAADRAVTALELIRLRKAPVLVLGGGGGKLRNGQSWSENAFLTNWIRGWNLPATNVVQLAVCDNTREEALQVQELAARQGWKRLLLVTSAYHMKRADVLFRKTGLEIVPVACDFIGLNRLERRERFRIFPTPGGFERLKIYVHEQAGWLCYRARGWI